MTKIPLETQEIIKIPPKYKNYQNTLKLKKMTKISPKTQKNDQNTPETLKNGQNNPEA